MSAITNMDNGYTYIIPSCCNLEHFTYEDQYLILDRMRETYGWLKTDRILICGESVYVRWIGNEYKVISIPSQSHRSEITSS